MITEHKFDHEVEDEMAALGLTAERLDLFIESLDAASKTLPERFRLSKIAEKTLYALPDDITPAELFIAGLMAGMNLAESRVSG